MTARDRRAPLPVHRNLVLVRACEPEQLDQLVARSNLADRCVRRLTATEALFPRSALRLLRRRLAELELDVVDVLPDHPEDTSS